MVCRGPGSKEQSAWAFRARAEGEIASKSSVGRECSYMFVDGELPVKDGSGRSSDGLQTHDGARNG